MKGSRSEISDLCMTIYVTVIMRAEICDPYKLCWLN